MKKFVLLSLIILLSNQPILAQGFYRSEAWHLVEYNHQILFNSGKKKVFEYSYPEKSLKRVISINKKDRTITITNFTNFKLDRTIELEKYNDSLSISSLKTFYYNEYGKNDSVITNKYLPKHITYRIIYHQSDDGKKLLGYDRYVYVDGVQTVHKTSQFENDTRGRIIKTVGGIYKREYNSRGRLLKRFHVETPIYEYLYNENDLLIRINSRFKTSTLFEYNEEELLIKEKRFKKDGSIDDRFTFLYSYQ